MKISKVHLENYKNISFGYVENLSDFVVIGGANGCGKSFDRACQGRPENVLIFPA